MNKKHYFGLLLVLVTINMVVAMPAQAHCPSSSNEDFYSEYTLAEQGDARPQTNLGLMYGNGQGVPQDDAQAHKWVNLAASNGHEGGI